MSVSMENPFLVGALAKGHAGRGTLHVHAVVKVYGKSSLPRHRGEAGATRRSSFYLSDSAISRRKPCRIGAYARIIQYR